MRGRAACGRSTFRVRGRRRPPSRPIRPDQRIAWTNGIIASATSSGSTRYRPFRTAEANRFKRLPGTNTSSNGSAPIDAAADSGRATAVVGICCCRCDVCWSVTGSPDGFRVPRTRFVFYRQRGRSALSTLRAVFLVRTCHVRRSHRSVVPAQHVQAEAMAQAEATAPPAARTPQTAAIVDPVVMTSSMTMTFDAGARRN